MASHRKQDLLKELDQALNRKVQEKYHKLVKTQQVKDPMAQTDFQGHHQRSKIQSQIDPKGYRSKDYHMRNTYNNTKKVPEKISSNNLKPHRSTQYIPLSGSQSNIVPERGAQSPRLDDKVKLPSPRNTVRDNGEVMMLKGQVKKLQEENYLLNKELGSFRTTLKSLEKESKALKRDESQILKMKQENASLAKEVQLLQNKIAQSSKNTLNSSLLDNLSFEQSLKQLMMQLNLSFINKEWSQNFIIESMKNISRQVFKVVDQKSKLSSKLKKFDLDSILAKQNNTSYKQEIQTLRLQVQKYQSELSACNMTIKQLDEQFNMLLKEKKQVESRCKEMTREAQSNKKELKMLTESSKHRKPKRQSSVIKKDRQSTLPEDATLFKSTATVQIQTQKEVSEDKTELKQDFQLIDKLESQIARLKRQVQKDSTNLQQLKEALHSKQDQNEDLLAKIAQLEDERTQLKVKLGELNEQNYHYEGYIKQLELKRQEITSDISSFMPKLKKMEEQNNELKQQNVEKDQQIINKLQIINQLRDNTETYQENISQYEYDLKNMKFNYDRVNQENERLKKQICQLNGKNVELEESMFIKQNDLTSTLQAQITASQEQIMKKEHQHEKALKKRDDLLARLTQSHEETINQYEQKLNALRKQNQTKTQQNTQEYSKIKRALQDLKQFNQRLEDTTSSYLRQKQNLKQAVQQILIMNRQLTKKQTQYQTQYNSIQNKILAFQSHNNQVNQSYSKLEMNLKQMEQEIKVVREENQQINMRNQGLMQEVGKLKLENKEKEYENKSCLQLQQYHEKNAAQMQAKNGQLMEVISILKDQNHKLEKALKQFSQSSQQFQMRQSHLLQLDHQKTSQLTQMQSIITRLTQQNTFLTQDYNKLESQAQKTKKDLMSQLDNQTYDIQRLIKQNKELQNKIKQIEKLNQSRQFQSNQNVHKYQALLQENKSLAMRYQYVVQELEMKERNKEEDRYLNQLKNRQYSLLVKRILSSTIEMQGLQHCNNLEELLQVGAQKVLNLKKNTVNQEEERNANEGNQYHLQLETLQRPKRFNFGIEISSYQGGLNSSRQKQIQKINQEETDKGKQQLKSPGSPRSIINSYQLSPQAARQGGQTQRVTSQRKAQTKI